MAATTAWEHGEEEWMARHLAVAMLVGRLVAVMQAVGLEAVGWAEAAMAREWECTRDRRRSEVRIHSYPRSILNLHSSSQGARQCSPRCTRKRQLVHCVYQSKALLYGCKRLRGSMLGQ